MSGASAAAAAAAAPRPAAAAPPPQITPSSAAVSKTRPRSLRPVPCLSNWDTGKPSRGRSELTGAETFWELLTLCLSPVDAVAAAASWARGGLLELVGADGLHAGLARRRTVGKGGILLEIAGALVERGDFDSASFSRWPGGRLFG
jgi:hypothetical protein